MSKLETLFKLAAERVRQLPRRPDNDTLLKLYAFYKQATVGDVDTKRPGFTDVAGRAKYDAWARLRGTTRPAAMRTYVDLVEELLVGVPE